MKETIQIIKDLADLTDNVYLLNKIDRLEDEIKIALIHAKIEVYKEINNNK